MVKTVSRDAEMIEWSDVSDGDECEWVNVEKCSRAIVQMRGHGTVEIQGTLFRNEDDESGVRVMRLTAADPIMALPVIPWRVRPVVHGGEATIRLYIPRG